MTPPGVNFVIANSVVGQLCAAAGGCTAGRLCAAGSGCTAGRLCDVSFFYTVLQTQINL